MEVGNRHEALGMALVLLLAATVFVVLGGPGAVGSMAQVALSTPTATATGTRPTATPTPSPTPLPTATATPPSLPTATPTPALVPWRVSTFRVPARSVHTLTVTLAPGQVLEGFFTVALDVGFSVVGPEGAPVLERGRTTGPQSFTVAAPTGGSYTLRFDNRYSLLTAKGIQLSYRITG